MLPAIKRILFATDLSENAAHAFTYAVSLAAASKAEVHVLHVVESLSDDARLTLMMFVQDEATRKNALDRRRDMARESLEQRQDRFWSSLGEDQRALRAHVTELEVVEGFPAEEILRRADRGHFDMIVLGAHQHGMSHSFLGNTAKRVMRRARIPTLVVPRNADS